MEILEEKVRTAVMTIGEAVAVRSPVRTCVVGLTGVDGNGLCNLTVDEMQAAWKGTFGDLI